MKVHFITFFSVLLFSAMPIQAQGQTDTYCWPIEGAKAGTNIICAPQGYIDDKINLEGLFIGAPEGSTVLCPADGEIINIGLSYTPALQQNVFWEIKDKSYDEQLSELRPQLDPKKYDPKYLMGAFSINCGNGINIYIEGLSGSEVFKTGQKIKKGTPIGKVAYSYHPIKEPSIKIAVSKYGKSDDPMTPFGLKTTFLPPTKTKQVEFLTQEQAKEDFNILIDALKESFPGLYDVISPEELEQYIQTTTTQIESKEGTWGIIPFSDLIHQVSAKIHDSHIEVHAPRQNYTFAFESCPAIEFGWFNDTLMVKQAITEYHPLIGCPIRAINGISADSLKRKCLSDVTGYDAHVTDYLNYHLAINSAYPATKKIENGIIRFDYDTNIEFTDGEKATVRGVRLKDNTRESWLEYYESFKHLEGSVLFMNINKHQNGYQFKILNDSVAYLGLSTFTLKQVQVEEIGSFIDSIKSNKKHLIIDVRNNGGGDDDVLSKLYSYIAGDTVTLNGYSNVTKKGDFKAFNYSTNYVNLPDFELFPDYQAEEGKAGYYNRSKNRIAPDSLINYPGKVYVLTNENSMSAATLFPAMLVRNGRGVVIGRETRSGYHFMNAVKFLQLRLPNSAIGVRIPLIKSYFDDVVNERVPYGRGVLPDYTVPISLDEIRYINGDAILNRTLELIKNGDYFTGKNPFVKSSGSILSELNSKTTVILSILGGAIVTLALLLFVYRKRKSGISKQ